MTEYTIFARRGTTPCDFLGAYEAVSTRHAFDLCLQELGFGTLRELCHTLDYDGVIASIHINTSTETSNVDYSKIELTLDPG